MLYCCCAYSIKEGQYGNSRLKVRKKEKTMKKMIRTAAVIMSTIMVLSMTACAKKADPKEVFDAAVKKNSELTSMDMDTTMKMTMTQGEETMDITVDMNMKMSNMNEDSMQYLAENFPDGPEHGCEDFL